MIIVITIITKGAKMTRMARVIVITIRTISLSENPRTSWFFATHFRVSSEQRTTTNQLKKVLDVLDEDRGQVTLDSMR